MSIRVSQTKYTDTLTESLNPFFKDVLEEISELASLEDDWDCEGAHSINRQCILRAQKFIESLACSAEEQSFSDGRLPAVFATIEGGIQLYWNANRHQISLTFDPGQQLIEAMDKTPDVTATFHYMTESEAGAIAHAAMSNTKLSRI